MITTVLNYTANEILEAPVVESKGRHEVPQIHPLVEHRTHHEPVSDVQFLEHFLVTCSWGKVKFWARPDDSQQPDPSSDPSMPPSSAPTAVPSTSSTPNPTPPNSTPPSFNIEPPKGN